MAVEGDIEVQPVAPAVARTEAAFAPGSRSAALAARALSVVAAGHSRTGIWQSPWPIYVASASGVRITDVDGDSRLDMNPNNTSLIHGHADSAVVAAAAAQLARGASFNLPTEQEVLLGEHVCRRIASVERVRLTNSGTEADMNAIRAAWAYTGRPKVAKFEGPYHGSYPGMDVSLEPEPPAWGPSDMPDTVPESAGLPEGIRRQTIVLPFNDAAACERIIRANAHELAAVIVEPVPSNLFWILPRPGFLEGLRRVTMALGVLLIFDEIVDFRLDHGGAQALYGVEPDLTTLGKFVGGGLPLGIVGGRADVMSVFDPERGPYVQHAGSFNGNPLAATAGRTALENLTPAAIARINALGDTLRRELLALVRAGGFHATVTGAGSLLCLFPTRGQVDPAHVVDYRTLHAARAPGNALAELRTALLRRGIANGAGQMSLTTVTTEADLAEYLRAVEDALPTAVSRG